MALLLAYVLVRAGWHVTLVTFGAPPPANKTVADYLESRLARNASAGHGGGSGEGGGCLLASYRVVNALDVVPHSLDSMEDYTHFGPPIVLDFLLMESCGLLADVAAHVAGYFTGQAGAADAGQNAAEGVIEHHLLDRYLENLNMQGPPNALQFARNARRVIEPIGNLLDKTGANDQMKQVFREFMTKKVPHAGKEAATNYIADKLLEDGSSSVVAGTAAAPAGAVAAIPVDPFAIVNIAISCANLGVSCVTLYKVSQLQTSMARSVELGEVCVDYLTAQKECLQDLKTTMGDGFSEVLNAIDDQNKESLLVIADTLQFRGAPYLDGGTMPGDDIIQGDLRYAGPAFKQLVRALKKENSQLNSSQSVQWRLWLLTQAMHATSLYVHMNQLRGVDRKQLQSSFVNDFYLELAPIMGNLILYQELSESDEIFLTVQLNATFNLAMGDSHAVTSGGGSSSALAGLEQQGKTLEEKSRAILCALAHGWNSETGPLLCRGMVSLAEEAQAATNEVSQYLFDQSIRVL